jgi:hypothetical protein
MCCKNGAGQMTCDSVISSILNLKLDACQRSEIAKVGYSAMKAGAIPCYKLYCLFQIMLG